MIIGAAVFTLVLALLVLATDAEEHRDSISDLPWNLCV
jgi:hypothetical protein